MILRLLVLLFFCSFTSTALAVSYQKLPDGRAITVVDSVTAKLEQEKANETNRKVYLYDRMTGVLILDKPEAPEHKVSQLFSFPNLMELFDETGEQIATVIGIERKKDKHILPFGYLRLQYLNEKAQSSGTFLFDRKGALVAVVYAQHEKHKEQGYASPIQAALRGYKDFTMNGKVSRSNVGIIISSHSSLPEIISVRPDLPAAAAGLKKGDILIKVGKYSISSYLEAVNAFYYLIPDNEEEFTVIRNGEKKVFRMIPMSR